MIVHFNPRPREEGDAFKGFYKDDDSGISIHALVKRATLSCKRVPAFQMHFNPRPREEGDSDLDISDIASSLISIHALVKRATSEEITIDDLYTISIHALVKRATHIFAKSLT